MPIFENSFDIRNYDFPKNAGFVHFAYKNLKPITGYSKDLHIRAGPKLLQECHKRLRERQVNELDEGQHIVTGGYETGAKHIYHTIAPICNILDETCEWSLRCTLKECAQAAIRDKLISIVFPVNGLINSGWIKETAIKSLQDATRETSTLINIIIAL